MAIKINRHYLWICVLLFLIELSIAIWGSGLVRTLFGDFLVVILVYSFFKIFIAGHTLKIAIVVLLLACGIEFLQWSSVLTDTIVSQNKVLNILVGSVFDWYDLLAYALGILLVVLVEKFWR